MKPNGSDTVQQRYLRGSRTLQSCSAATDQCPSAVSCARRRGAAAAQMESFGNGRCWRSRAFSEVPNFVVEGGGKG